MDIKKESLELHKRLKGKLEIKIKGKLENYEDLTLMYSPGVAEPCLEIQKDFNNIYEYTSKSNTIAVITNGTAVLGLGDIGAGAGLPVMEGKAALFKAFANIDAIPICIDTKNPDKIIETIKLISPSYGGINLEDIKAPECFYIEDSLKKALDIPVFHDDQHGTAVIVLAGLKNALKLLNKKIKDIKITVNGIGAAGSAVIKLLVSAGAKNIVACDRNGIIFNGCINDIQEFGDLVESRKSNGYSEGSLADAIKGSDVFIGVSVAGCVTREMAMSMNKNAVIFALANPNPEIMPDDAKAAGVKIICTGRSDFPNQINNVLAFPGIFRGALDVRAKAINEEMKLAAVDAIANLISTEDLRYDYIIPNPFDKRVVPEITKAVKKAAAESGVARL